MDFRVAIRKRESSGPSVVTSRKIDHHPTSRLIGPAIHAAAPFAVVDAVASFIQEHDGHRRPWFYHLAHLLILLVTSTPGNPICVRAVKPTEHRNAALPRKGLPRVRPGGDGTR